MRLAAGPGGKGPQFFALRPIKKGEELSWDYCQGGTRTLTGTGGSTGGEPGLSLHLFGAADASVHIGRLQRAASQRASNGGPARRAC